MIDSGANGKAIARLLAWIKDNSPKEEPFHERDCFACDVASEIVGSLAAYWSEDNEWFDSITDWPGGVSIAQQGEKIVAHVLHRRLYAGKQKRQG